MSLSHQGSGDHLQYRDVATDSHAKGQPVTRKAVWSAGGHYSCRISFPSVHLSCVCLSFSFFLLSFCLSVCVSVSMSFCRSSICLSSFRCLSVCWSVDPSFNLSAFLSRFSGCMCGFCNPDRPYRSQARRFWDVEKLLHSLSSTACRPPSLLEILGSGF